MPYTIIEPVFESTRKRDRTLREVLADSLCGDDENFQITGGQDVEVISFPMGSEKEEKSNLGDF